MTDLTEVRRKAFEAWAYSNKYDIARLPGYPESYDRIKTFEAWRVWQAALDSVVVKLPTIHRDGDEGYNNAIEHCREAIHSAGVKTDE